MSEATQILYTLVAYRPNGVDTCRSCVMASSDSDQSIVFYKDADKLVEAWARIVAADLGSDREFCPHEFTLLLDGRDADMWAEENEEWTQGPDQLPHYALQERAEKLGKEWHDRNMDERQRQEAAAKEREAHALQAQELALYRKLHAKFGARAAKAGAA